MINVEKGDKVTVERDGYAVAVHTVERVSGSVSFWAGGRRWLCSTGFEWGADGGSAQARPWREGDDAEAARAPLRKRVEDAREVVENRQYALDLATRQVEDLEERLAKWRVEEAERRALMEEAAQALRDAEAALQAATGATS